MDYCTNFVQVTTQFMPGFIKPMFLLMLLPVLGTSQINLKVAYLGTYGNYDGINAFLQAKNELAGANLVEGFKEPQFLNGLDLGLRYKTKSGTAIEAGWNFGQPRILKQSSLNNGDQLVEETWKMQNNGIYAGIQQHIGSFSFGTNLQYNTLSMATIPDLKSRYEVDDRAPYWTAQFYIQLEYRTNLTAIALRPHYSLPITSYTFSPTATNTSYTQSLTTYGISLIIYNGE